MPEDDDPGAELVPAPRQAAAGRSAGSFTYSGDPSSSDQDTVRFLVGDTDPAGFLLNDDEIQFLIDTAKTIGLSNPLLQAAAAGAEAIASKLSREISYSADGVSVSGDTLAAKFYTVAEKIRTLGLRSDVAAAPLVGGILVGEYYDPSIRPLTFAVGMHDNYLAGQQDFGGSWTGYSWYTPGTMAMALANRTLVQQAIEETKSS